MTTLPTGNLGRAAGFTLLEVLLAMVILSLVMGMLYGGFSGSLRSYRAGLARGELTRDWLGAVQLLQRDVARRVVYEKYPLELCRDQMSFVLLEAAEGGRLMRVRYAIVDKMLTRNLDRLPAGGSALGLAKAGGMETPGAGQQTLLGQVQEGGFDQQVDGAWVAAPAATGDARNATGAGCGTTPTPAKEEGKPEKVETGVRLRVRVGEADAGAWMTGAWLMPLAGKLMQFDSAPQQGPPDTPPNKGPK